MYSIMVSAVVFRLCFGFPTGTSIVIVDSSALECAVTRLWSVPSLWTTIWSSVSANPRRMAFNWRFVGPWRDVWCGTLFIMRFLLSI